MSFETSELANLNSSELKVLLKDLHLYKSLKKQLGNRGMQEYNKIKTGEKKLLIEYFPTLDKDFVLKQAKTMYKNIFNIENIDEFEIQVMEKDSIKGGMRIFLDDKVLDLSYSKIENQFG